MITESFNKTEKKYARILFGLFKRSYMSVLHLSLDKFKARYNTDKIFGTEFPIAWGRKEEKTIKKTMEGKKVEKIIKGRWNIYPKLNCWDQVRIKSY